MGASQRREPRYAFDASVRLRGVGGIEIPARTKDLSLAGCAVRLSAEALDVPSVRFAEVVSRLRELFAASLEIYFESAGVHGTRVLAKQATVVRMMSAGDEGDTLELGCLFAAPLEEPEIKRLGATSALADSEEAGEQRTSFEWENVDRNRRGPGPSTRATPDGSALHHAEWGGRPAEGHRRVQGGAQCHPVLIRGRRQSDATLNGLTELVTGHAILVRVRGAGVAMGIHRPTLDLTHVAQRFHEIFGPQLRLLIGAPANPTWQGWAHTSGIEIAHDQPNDVLVTLSLERPMDAEALKAVGLAAN